MFCQNCGTQLENGTRYCPNCGVPVAAPEPPAYEDRTVAASGSFYQQPEQPMYEQPEQPVYQQPEQPAYQEPVVTSNPEANALSTPILIFGILGIAFGCSFYLSFLGIIFSGIAKGKVKQFLAAGGVLSGKAKVGNILAKVGMILGIVLTVFFVIWVIAIIVAAVQGSNAYIDYNWY